MQHLNKKRYTGTAYLNQIYKLIFGSAVLVLFLSSCSMIPTAQRDIPIVEKDASPPRYSIVLIIHGDGSYLYHDSRGNEYQADEETLADAKKVAVNNKDAEVFIFHQKAGRRFLGLFFRLRDGDFYYYRNGQLIANKSYRRGHGHERFAPEAELYNRFRINDHSYDKNLFLYFGHEIPEFNGSGYDASYRNRSFTVDYLAAGLKKLTGDTFKFDLIVLSTCFNGSPYTVSALSPYARYILASPDNLHLSYFDLQPLERLDFGSDGVDISSFTKSYAKHSFNRLKESVHTAVSVSVYDIDRVQEYLHSIEGVYNQTLISLNGVKPVSLESFDCAEDPGYARPGMSEGVKIFYRPSRFGRTSTKEFHSGWTCRRLPK